MSAPAITFSNLTLGYHSHPAVHHLDGTVQRGSLTAVVGINGCGKSTLMKGIAGLLAPMSGRCAVTPGLRVAYLPQQSELDRTFPAEVIDLVRMGLWSKRGLLRRFTGADRTAVADALALVGLEGFERRSLDTLSGGQLQRALFARVVVQEADILLLDEPFNAMDEKTVEDLLALIDDWHGRGLTVMTVVHDLDLVRRRFPETLLLARRTVAWGATRDVLTGENLREARRFDEAWKDDAPWCEAAPGAHDHGTGHPHEHAHAHAHDHGDGHIHAGGAAHRHGRVAAGGAR
jgi:zinc/manganese transport system ATP-binding protein